MLATRVVTAVVLVPLVVAGVLWLPNSGVGIVFAVLAGVGAWEWARLAGWRGVAGRCGFTLLYGVVTAVLLWRIGTADDALAHWVTGAACVWWLAAVYWLLRFPAGWGATLGRPLIGGASGLLLLCAASVAVVAIHGREAGTWLLLVLLALVWGADTGAYFVGRTLGRRRLAPTVSPGKTLEGAVGGVLTALLVAAISALLLGYDGDRLLATIVLGGWIAVVSIVGDLTVSMFKRAVNLKDTGAVFPGHGGVLDRIDSLLAAAPWFALGLLWLPHG